MDSKPYDVFIRFLITKGAEAEEEVNEKLKELNLPEISSKAFVRHYETTLKLLPPAFLKQIEKQDFTPDFLKWMKILGIEDMWLFEKPFRRQDHTWVKLVYDINTDPVLRISINALLVKGVKIEDVAEIVGRKYSTLLKPLHVELYRKVFFDPARMTRAAWRSYLGVLEPADRAIMFTALTEDVNTLKTELGLPSVTSLSDSLQYLFSSAYQKSRFYLKQTSPIANDEARKWISTTIHLADKYDKYKAGDVADFSKTLQMEFEFIDHDFPTPDAETLGNLKTEIDAKAKRVKEDELNQLRIEEADDDPKRNA